jgi:hypothetical protein
MRSKYPRRLALAVLAAFASPLAYSANFVYEGRLDDFGRPANGRYDLKLTAYRQAAQGTTLAAPMTFEGVEVRDGRFRLDMDLALVESADVWLEVAVRQSGSPAFSAVPGRSKAIAAPLIGACWSTTGDSGSDPALNFLGTTDAQPLVLRTANAQSLRIEPSSLTAGSPALPITANIMGGSHVNAISTGVRGATISGGGVINGAEPQFDFGNPNRVTDHYGTIGGGYANQAGDGAGSINDKGLATISGGGANSATGAASSIGGGFQNSASGTQAAIGGGFLNTASGESSTVAGGFGNTASGGSSTVGGGSSNRATQTSSTVGGGSDNTASGGSSVVSGGRDNCAGGGLSWAGGYRAKARPPANPGGNGSCAALTYPGGDGDQGTFIWADAQDVDFVSSGRDQFAVRAAGGFGLNTAPPTSGIVEMTLQSSVNGGDVSNLWMKQRGVADGILFNVGTGNGSNNAGFFIDHYDGSNQARRMELATNGSVLIRSNVTGGNSGVTMAAGGGSFTSLSDRRVKTAIEAVDGLAILDQVVDLPISTWSYIAQGTGIRHIGPMAQDFRAAFAVGESETGITTIDADGVALAAIQGLNQKLEAENAVLRAESSELRARLDRLEALLTGQPGGQR